MLADFTVTVHYDGKPRAVQIKVHDNVAALRSAAARHANLGRRKKDADFSDTLGVCHRFENYGRDGKLKPVCAIVRLAPPSLGVGVVSHELAHAAVWIRQLEVGEDLSLIAENDEDFCWVLGELMRCVTGKLIDKGIYESL